VTSTEPGTGELRTGGSLEVLPDADRVAKDGTKAPAWKLVGTSPEPEHKAGFSLVVHPPAVRLSPNLAKLRLVGLGLIGLQLVSVLVYSVIEFQRYALTSDYAFYASAFYQLAHARMPGGFFQNHGELAFALLAPTYWLWPHGPILLWDQDLAVIAAEVVAFCWICEIAGKVRDERMSLLLAGTGLVALLADPWIWWTLAFDFHFETFGALFAVLFAWELHKGRRRAWLWAGLTLLSGDVSATYVIAIAIGALIVSRRWLWGVLAGAAGLVWFAALHALGAQKGSGNLIPLSHLVGTPPPGQTSSLSFLYHLSIGLLRRPDHVLSTIWSERLNAWANVAASGLLGILAPTVLFVPFLVITENSLYDGRVFSQPLFQSIPIYIFGPVGAVMFLVWLAVRRPRLVKVLAAVVIVETIVWGAIWLPRTPHQWIRVSHAAASEINRVSNAMPTGSEVVASQGIGGRFASGHDYVAVVGPGGSVALDGKPVWFFIAPSVGIETAPVASQYAIVAELAGLHARPLVVGSHGIWAYQYTPPPGQKRLALPGLPTSVPAWVLNSSSGTAIRSGPVSKRRVVGSGRSGYLVWGDDWREPTGLAFARAVISGNGPVSVEVWDVTTDTLLARREPPLTARKETILIPFEVPPLHASDTVYQGWGPFSSRPVTPPGDQLEVRIYIPGPGTQATAYSVGISSPKGTVSG
jgi:uncharacterized membrane protein